MLYSTFGRYIHTNPVFRKPKYAFETGSLPLPLPARQQQTTASLLTQQADGENPLLDPCSSPYSAKVLRACPMSSPSVFLR